MSRKTILAITAAAALGAITLAPTAASAGHWRSHGPGPGFHHRGHGHFHGFHGPRFHRFHGHGFASCWRVIPTRFVFAKVWVCR
jgi:Spy/CpxP family protein refolding chaperone